MDYTLFKIKYVGKPETPFNIRLNNHRSDVSDPNTILSCCHFAQSNHDFNNHTQLTTIETIANRNKPTGTIQDALRKRGKFWIITLNTWSWSKSRTAPTIVASKTCMLHARTNFY